MGLIFNTEQDERIEGERLLFQPTLLRNLLGMLSVSFVMIWVEILVLKYLLLPQINAVVINPVRHNTAVTHNRNSTPSSSFLMTDTVFTPVDSIFNTVDTTNNPPMTTIAEQVTNATIFALEADEDRMITKSNTFIMLLSFIPWFIVSFIMYVFYNRLKMDQKLVQGHMEIFGFQTRATVISTIVSVLIFCVFQYAFYELGVKFQYETPDEINLQVRQRISKELC